MKRIVLVWARRHGKDKTIFNWCITALCTSPQVCYYCLPEFSHGRRVIWDNIDNSGFPLLKHIPEELVKTFNKQEMKVEFYNGSIFQIVGADSYDKLIGANPKIVVFSEYAVTNPRAWDYLRPILDNPENNGVAVFISTPRGKNHFYDLYKVAIADPENWFVEIISNHETQILKDKDIDRLRREGMSEDMIQQEFYCSFAGTMEGSFYARYLMEAENEGRIGFVPYDPNYLVYTAWDLGFSDSMVITYFQVHGDQSIHVIDHYENKGYALPHYVSHVLNKPYNYATHFFPHDGKRTDLATGNTFQQTAEQMGLTTDIIPNELSIAEGIEVVRGLMPRIFIDKGKCEYLLKCLNNYASEYDEKNKILKSKPSHNWCSHSADSIRYMCLAVKNNFIGRPGASEWTALKSNMGYYDDIKPISYKPPFMRGNT
ncbi:MAG: hypothetical protein ACYC0F_20330 [Rhodanobacter sp.]